MTSALLTYALRTLLGGLLLSTCLVQADPVDQSWQTVKAALTESDQHRIITKAEWDRYDPMLLNPASQYPDLEHYNWSQLQQLRRLHESCQLPPHYPAMLRRAIEFEQALCAGSVLPLSWFESGPLLHPAGGGYADRYVEAWQNRQGDTSSLEKFLRRASHLLTVTHPSQPLARRLDRLGEAGLMHLQTVNSPFLDPTSGILWIRLDSGIYRFADQAWRPVVKQQQLALSTVGENPSCSFIQGNLCIRHAQAAIDLPLLLLTLLLVLASTSILHLSWQRYRSARERRFILQLLTHELRTPIASLSMTVEQLRPQFDQLDANGQAALGRLLQDHQRLQQVAHSSQGYLSRDSQAFKAPTTGRLSDWLDHVTAGHPVTYCLDEDADVALPFYWLGLCLDNLLRNALEHGAEPIRLNVRTSRRLELEVADAGTRSSRRTPTPDRTRLGPDAGAAHHGTIGR